MKKFVEVTEVDSSEENFTAFLGKQVFLICSTYNYAGKLIGVNDNFVLLEDGAIVYETGAFSAEKWKDAQKVGKNMRVMIHAIESWFEGK